MGVDVTDPATRRHGSARLDARQVAAVFLAASAVLLGTSAAIAQEDPRVLRLDFEDAPAAPSGSPAPEVGGHYEAVVFGAGVVGLEFSDDSIPALPGLPSSGRVVLGDCYAAEFCSNRIEAFFGQPVGAVSVLVGSRTPVLASGRVALVGVDSEGQAFGPLDTTVFEVSQSPVPVRRELTLRDPRGGIAGFRLEWLEGSGSGLVLDDLTVIPPVVELTPETVPEVLDGSDGPSSAPLVLRNTGTVSLDIAALVVESASVSGPGEFSLVDNQCQGVSLGPDEICSAVVQFVSPEAGESSAQILAILDADVVAASVRVSGFATPRTQQTPDAPATPEATSAGQPQVGDRDEPRGGGLVVAVALILAAIVTAVVAGRVLSRRRSRLPSRRPQVRVRQQPGETELSSPAVDLSIRARLRVGEGQTTVEEGNVP